METNNKDSVGTLVGSKLKDETGFSPMVSVIIPFRNNIGALRMCLTALEAQEYPRSKFEIIAIDNDSRVETEMIKSDFPDVVWLKEMRAGSYAARNAALLKATGQVVAFTDADCVPSRKWLYHATRELHRSQATIIGGRIAFFSSNDGTSLTSCESFEAEMFDILDHRCLIGTSGFAATANMITYGEVFERVGRFDCTLKSSGDREWGQRAKRNGAVVKYCDDAIIWHPRRNSFRQLQRKIRRLKGGMVTLAIRDRSADNLRLALRFTILDPKMYRVAFRPKYTTGILSRLSLFLLTIGLCCIGTMETLRVAFGGKTYRGS
jgi:glycosyltransferase involved in cell wall biosynthesis